jgi:MarR family 2-MHQ and catechol resistance regulon transcriptional repressor
MDEKRDDETSGIHIWLLMWKATRALEAHALENLETLGMCRSDFGVLEALLHKGPLPVSALGQKVLLTSGSITIAVDRLERRGYVERRGDSADRRTRIVHLTTVGSQVIGRLYVEHERAMERAVGDLPRARRAALVATLRELGRGAEERARAQSGPGQTRVRRARKEKAR